MVYDKFVAGGLLGYIGDSRFVQMLDFVWIESILNACTMILWEGLNVYSWNSTNPLDEAHSKTVSRGTMHKAVPRIECLTVRMNVIEYPVKLRRILRMHTQVAGYWANELCLVSLRRKQRI